MSNRDDPALDHDVPDHWTATARDTAEAVLGERPDLAGAELGLLDAACEAISVAEALDAVARAADYVATGSTGQAVIHPAIAEARLQRKLASDNLARLVDPAKRAEIVAKVRRGAARSRFSSAGGR